MRKFKDLTGQKFGRLTALYRLHNTKGKTKWLCICECGNLSEVNYGSLVYGSTKSCGCLHKEGTHHTHNKSNTRLHRIWRNIKSRCYNSNKPDYQYYGARGITVCDEWHNDFMSFYNWAVNNGYDDTLTIDRIDVNGYYEPNNCRWVTMKQQSRNRRNIKQYTINGEQHCLSEWCKILGLNFSNVRTRIYSYHWPIERALELEV